MVCAKSGCLQTQQILPGNVCRKLFKFPENPGNLNWWNCNIILMTINKAYLGTLRAMVTLTYIPVITSGLYDTFPGSPETFPWHIWSFPGRFWMEILIFTIYTEREREINLSNSLGLYYGKSQNFYEEQSFCRLLKLKLVRCALLCRLISDSREYTMNWLYS